MQPILYIFVEDTNEILYTTKIIKNEANEYQVLSSNYFNLGFKETELKEFVAPIKNNKIIFGFIPEDIYNAHIRHDLFTALHINYVINIIEYDIGAGKIIDNRFIINVDQSQVSFSIHINDAGNKSLYGPIIRIDNI